MAQSYRTSLSLEADLHEALAEKAENEGKSLGSVIRNILRDELFGKGAEGPIKGVGDLAQKLLLEGASNERVLQEVQKAFPNGSTSIKSISWYRSKLRRDGHDVLTQIAARRAEQVD